MDTLKIKLFLLVEKYKNFSKIADEFSYTPSAISHMADALEEELGLKIFKRTNKGVLLTEDGRRLYHHFEALAAAEADLFKEASSIVANNRYSLRIGAYSSVALHFLPAVLQSFKKDYPYVKTTILVDDNMQNWLEKGIVDIILADELIGNDMWQPLLEEEYVVVAPESEFGGRDEIDINELYEYVFIKPVEKNLKKYLNYSRFHDIIEVESIENNSLIFMVKEKLGITVLPQMSIGALPEGVRSIKLRPEIKRKVGIFYDDSNPSWPCEHFIQHIKKKSSKWRNVENKN